MSDTKTQLTCSQEKLLMRFIDGECAFFERWRAERLITGNYAAKNFVDAALKISSGLQELEDITPGKLDNMWQRVNARLAQEERAAVFHGPRHDSIGKSVSTAPSWYDSLGELLSWRNIGLSGVLAAACAAFIVVKYQPQNAAAPVNYAKDNQDPSSYFSTVNQSTQPAMNSLEEGALSSRPQLVEERAPGSLEVDWVRSRGRVRLMQDPDENSTIIWVKRRSPVSTFARSQERRDLSGVPMAIPIATR